jgi:4-amino-4-deoxy-L-arabinose transferase-like glycosyltransferase
MAVAGSRQTPALRRDSADVAGIAAVLAFATILRLYKMTASAIWFDEAVAITFADYSWPEMFDRLPDDILPPLYFVVLKVWQGVFGDSVIALRTLSIGFEVAAVWLSYVLVRSLRGGRTFALTAALFLAVNPFQIHYSREVRMYAMGVFLVLLTSLLLARALIRRELRWWISYGLAVAASILTHYFLAFSVLAQGVVAATVAVRAALHGDRRMLAHGLVAAGVAGAVFLPWVPACLEQQRHLRSDTTWLADPTLERVLRIPWVLVLGGSDPAWMPGPYLVAAVLGLAAVLAVVVWRGRSWEYWLIVAQAILPIAAGLGLAAAGTMPMDRYFVFASAFWSIMMAAVASRLSARWLRFAATGAVVIVSLGAFAINLNAAGLLSLRRPAQRPGMAGAAAHVNRHADARQDAVVVAHSLIYLPFKYYNRTGIRPWLYGKVPLDQFAYYSGAPLLRPDEMIYDLESLASARRVWYLWTDGFYQTRFPVPATWRWVERHEFVDTVGFKGTIYVDLYALSAPAVEGASSREESPRRGSVSQALDRRSGRVQRGGVDLSSSLGIPDEP